MEAGEVSGERWQTLSPLLYDTFVSQQRVWPTLTCRWGPPLPGVPGADKSRQRLFYSEQARLPVPVPLPTLPSARASHTSA